MSRQGISRLELILTIHILTNGAQGGNLGRLYWEPVEHPLRKATIKDLETYLGRTLMIREESKVCGRGQKLREKTNFAIIADQPLLGLLNQPGSCFVARTIFTDLYLIWFCRSIDGNLLRFNWILWQLFKCGGRLHRYHNGSDDLYGNVPSWSFDHFRKYIKRIDETLVVHKQIQMLTYFFTAAGSVSIHSGFNRDGVDIFKSIHQRRGNGYEETEKGIWR